MIAIDPIIYKIVEFWSAIASLWIDGFVMWLALIWLQDYRADRTDKQGKVLFLLFGLSALLAFTFILCVAKVIVPMRLQ